MYMAVQTHINLPSLDMILSTNNCIKNALGLFRIILASLDPG